MQVFDLLSLRADYLIASVTGIMMVYSFRLLFLGVPVLDRLRSLLPSRYYYGILQYDGFYAIHYRAWWMPWWSSYSWVQSVPAYVHERRNWWGKLIRTRRNWRLARLTEDFGEAQLQLARLKSRHIRGSRQANSMAQA